MKPLCIIVDIDGTIAQNKHRSPYATELCMDDKIILPVHRIVATVGCTVIFVSGRYEKYRDLTVQRLRQFGVNYSQLFMRKDGDERKDNEIKEEILKEHILPNYDVFFAIDDRNRVVDMWRANGIFTFDVNQTREEF